MSMVQPRRIHENSKVELRNLLDEIENDPAERIFDLYNHLVLTCANVITAQEGEISVLKSQVAALRRGDST